MIRSCHSHALEKNSSTKTSVHKASSVRCQCDDNCICCGMWAAGVPAIHRHPRSAANPPAAATAVNRQDRQMDRHRDRRTNTWQFYNIYCARINTKFDTKSVAWLQLSLRQATLKPSPLCVATSPSSECFLLTARDDSSSYRVQRLSTTPSCKLLPGSLCTSVSRCCSASFRRPRYSEQTAKLLTACHHTINNQR